MSEHSGGLPVVCWVCHRPEEYLSTDGRCMDCAMRAARGGVGRLPGTIPGGSRLIQRKSRRSLVSVH